MSRRLDPGPIAAWVAAGLAAISLLLVFALPGDLLLAAGNTDMISEFVAWRAYLADSLRAGHVPLWNPYTYGGQPFLSGFESAVLYPPNLLFVLLPLAPALNFSILLHLILLGWGMQRWAIQRGLHPMAAGLAGLLLPLSGAVFPHVYAGHLSNLCTMAWAPWLFAALERKNLRGYVLAAACICLQILAGHVQYVFYTALAAGIHAVVLAISGPSRWRPIAGFVACYAAAGVLGAAQLFPAIAASTESIRQQKLDYSFAAMFGFPPENFLTLIAPGFFGSLGQPVYWGRCYLWEMSLFVGTAGLVLLAIAVCDRTRRRQAWLDLAVALPLIVLALGVHTPLFDLLYAFAPGFGHFRSWSKFIFPATLFLVPVIASGADLLLRGDPFPRRIGWVSVAAGGAVLLAGLVVCIVPDSVAPLLRFVQASRESYLPSDVFTRTDFIDDAGTHAGWSLALGGAVLAGAGAILLAPWRRFSRWGVPALVAVEMIGFAAGQVTISHLSDAAPDGLKKFIGEHPGDYRVLNLMVNNNGYLLGAGDLWGNNPTVLRRYAEFITWSQGGDPDHATQYATFSKLSPLYALLRLRYAFVPSDGGLRVAESRAPPLPWVTLISEAKTLWDRDAIFSAMSDPAFDPRRTVLLEGDPVPPPAPDAKGSATLVATRPDELIIEADTDKPALLLITDLYARGWRAEPLTGSVQTKYEVMPADYVLRAIPLQAGHHRLRVVYAPAAFPIGVAVSVVAWLAWVGFLVRTSSVAAAARWAAVGARQG
jgi:hypothetical protein